MSSNSFASTVDLRLKPSARALQALFWLHAGPLVLLPLAMEPGLPMVLIGAALALSWIWLRRHAAFGFGPRAIGRITWHAEGHWTLQAAGGDRSVEAELLGNSYRQSAILILNFRTRSGRRLTRILLGDEAAPEALRRLRARLSTWTPETSPTP